MGSTTASEPVRRELLASAWWAAVLYGVLSVVMTWPLGRGLWRDVPSDLGDPLLNCWILAWGAERLLRAVQGDPGAIAGFWEANIFYPSHLSLAYSEHLLPQAVQALPVYALTGNVILSYNLIFLSTFVLSGLGAYWLVRELTGDSKAAFAAGCFFAFAPFRAGHFSHLQVLSAQWMPFILVGIRRFVRRRSGVALIGAALAWLAQNLSCGYYLLYLPVLLVAYTLWELLVTRTWLDRRVWAPLAVASVAVAVLTMAWIAPYSRLRASGFPPRSIAEVEYYSADVLSFATAPEALSLWGRVLRLFPGPEGDLFPGLTPLALAVIAVAWALGIPGTVRDPRSAPASAQGARQQVAQGGLGPLQLLGRFLRSPAAPFLFTTIVAASLALGPTVRVAGREIADGPYRLLYAFMPGFDGVRAAARFGMLMSLGLSILGGLGVHALRGATRRLNAIVVLVVTVFAAEALPWPMPLNGRPDPSLSPSPPSFVQPAIRAPRIYRRIRDLPRGSAIIELPIGIPAYEARYVYYSTVHWRPIVNGYSGGFPRAYRQTVAALRDLPDNGDGAWAALRLTGATHIVVHESAFPGARGAGVSHWVEAQGGVLLDSFGPDRLYAVNGRVGPVDRRPQERP